MKNRLLFVLLVLLMFNVSYAQHWTELMKNNGNYYEVKAAFEKEFKGKEYEKGQGVSQFKRWEHFMLKHMDKDGNYIPSTYIPQKNTRIKSNSGPWQQLGPFNSPGIDGENSDGIGQVGDIGFHPTDTLIFYVGSSSGGVWKTVDGGLNYSYLSKDWPSNKVDRIQVNPLNPDEIWAGSVNFGMMYSNDAGLNWEKNSFVKNPMDFLYNHHNNIILLSDASLLNHYSSDGGLNWNTINGLPYLVNDFCLHPTDPTIVYTITNNGLFISNDGGKNFSQIYPSGNLPLGNTTNRIAVSEAEPNSIWLLSVSNSRFNGLYKSTDKGSSFSLLLDKQAAVKPSTIANYTKTAYDLFEGQGWIHSCLGVSPIDANNVFVGGVHIIHTEDGQDWLQADAGWSDQRPHVDHLNIRFQPITNAPFSCNDGGVYKGLSYKDANGNYIWKSLNETMAITEMYNLSVSYSGDKVLTGQQDNGSYMYENNTNEWRFLQFGDGMSNGIDPANDNISYLAFQYGNALKSTNDWNSFEQILTSSDLGESSSFFTRFMVHPKKPNVLYNLRKNLWCSEDGGYTWNSLTSSLGIDFSNGYFDISEENPEIMSLVASKGAYRTDDGGKNWTKINLPKNNYGSDIYSLCLELHETDSKTMWVNDNQNVYETKDGGTTWKKFSTWQYLNINEIMHVGGTDDEILLATTVGVFLKANGQDELVELDNSLPVVSVTDIDMNYCTGELYASTYGMGAWKIPYNLSTTACCNLSPSLTNKKSRILLCSNENTLEIENPSGEYYWSKDGQSLGTGSSINVTETGNYSVYKVEGNCQSATLDINTFDISSDGTVPSCVKFENNLEEHITVLKDWNLHPVSVVQNSSCDTMDNQVFKFEPYDSKYGTFNLAKDTVVLALPKIDLTNVSEASLSFDVANQFHFNPDYSTNLTIQVSTDCGATFSKVFSADKTVIGQTVYGDPSNYIPSSCDDWKHFEIDLSSYQGNEIVVLFQIHSPDNFISYWGCGLYLDNICTKGTAVATKIYNTELVEKDVKVYPNPVYNILNISSEYDILDIKLYDINGKLINVRTRENQVDFSQVNTGSYILEVTTEKGVSRVNVNKGY